MKAFLKNAWQDIKDRKNIELYLTLAVALGLLAASIFGIQTTSAVMQLILVALTVLIYGMVSQKQFTDRTDKNFGQLNMMLQNARDSDRLRTYPHWRVREIQDILTYAKESIVVIDSWYGEAPALAGFVRDGKSHRDTTLDVKIYMLDPDKPFGAQRYSEFSGIPATNSVCNEQFRLKFNDSISTARRHLEPMADVRLAFYKYSTMPEIRMFIVDDMEFIFGWFPVDGPSAENVCFHVSETDAEEAKRTIQMLRKHYQGLQKVSTPVPEVPTA
jgi:hypothetical protein